VFDLTGKGSGLKPGWIVGRYAALKRRSSTVLQWFVGGRLCGTA